VQKPDIPMTHRPTSIAVELPKPPNETSLAYIATSSYPRKTSAPHLGKSAARIHRVCDLARVRSILGVSLVTVEVEDVVTRRVLYGLVRFHCLDPSSQPAVLVGRRPPPVWLEHSGEAQEPRRNRDVNVGHGGTEEERASWVSDIDEFRDFTLELLGVLDLRSILLGLKEAVEPGDYVAVDMVHPQSGTCSILRILGEERRSGIKVFQILQQHCALVAAPVAVFQCGHQPTRVYVGEELWLSIRIDLARRLEEEGGASAEGRPTSIY